MLDIIISLHIRTVGHFVIKTKENKFKLTNFVLILVCHSDEKLDKPGALIVYL